MNVWNKATFSVILFDQCAKVCFKFIEYNTNFVIVTFNDFLILQVTFDDQNILWR